jgi:hypothetical protein
MGKIKRKHKMDIEWAKDGIEFSVGSGNVRNSSQVREIYKQRKYSYHTGIALGDSYKGADTQ